MTPAIMRQVWELIENTQASMLLRQDDPSLVAWVLSQLANRRSLEQQEAIVLRDYLRSRTALIRDLAAQRS
ncbi:MAG: hypothetical protein HC838_14070 [Spirulinaceae cyanobacterium RM2_2_10]|nr:hypothetical protein [Spirulinaceae cyanobacterium SM2_1_0]NJO20934.1 hypothetical protein [Spirulinaceae cyanobacterium RM2_2_10]